MIKTNIILLLCVFAIGAIGAIGAIFPSFLAVSIGGGVLLLSFVLWPTFAIWCITSTIVFPITITQYAGFNIKPLDIVIVLGAIASVIKLLVFKQYAVKNNGLSKPLFRYIVMGSSLFFFGNIVSGISVGFPDFTQKYLIEAIEAYALPILIGLGLMYDSKLIKTFMYSLVVISVLGAFQAFYDAFRLQSMGIFTLGAFEGVNRLRGAHSFGFGYIMSVACVVAFALALEGWSGRKEDQARASVSRWMPVMWWGLCWVILLLATALSLVRGWLFAGLAGMIVVLILHGVRVKPVFILIIASVPILIIMAGFQDLWTNYAGSILGRIHNIRGDINTRYQSWNRAWMLYGHNVLIGVGGNGAKLPISTWFATEADVDNGYLQILLEVGALGFMGVLLLVWGSIVNLLKKIIKVVKLDSPKDIVYWQQVAMLGALCVPAISLFVWNLWSQGSSVAILTGFLITIAFLLINQDRLLHNKSITPKNES